MSDQDSDKEDPKPKGNLLSVLDPEMWIDRKCRINVGKFKGMHGRVLRSGNGWVQLKLENSNENTAKRAYELTLLEDMATIKELYAKSVEKEKKQRAASGRGGDNYDDNGDHEDGEDEEDDDDDASRSGTEDAITAEQTEDSQGEESSGGGTRSRRLSTRGSYGLSWIEKKVLLPNRKGIGIVKKADRDTCTVEIGASKLMKVFKKKELTIVPDDHEDPSKSPAPGNGNGSTRYTNRMRNNMKAKERLGLPEGATLMGTTPSRYAAFQDQVKRFVMRRREKVKKRPNLIEWQAQLNLRMQETGRRDDERPDVVDLLVVPHCEICGIEKEELNGPCWNTQCPRCIAFDVQSADQDGFARLPVVPIQNESVTVLLHSIAAEEASRKRRRISLNGTMTETADLTSNDALDTSQDTPVSDDDDYAASSSTRSPAVEDAPKKAKKDTAKTKKAAVNGKDLSKKVDKPAKKRPLAKSDASSAADQPSSAPQKKTKQSSSSSASTQASKKSKSDKPSSNAVNGSNSGNSGNSTAAKDGSQKPSSFRPQYESVFSR